MDSKDLTRTASTGFSLQSLCPGDLVEYRTGFLGGAWRPGFIVLLERYEIQIRDAYSQRVHFLKPGGPGKVRHLVGAHLVADVQNAKAIERAQLRELPLLTPVIVRTGGQPVAVPRPRRRHCCAAYLRFVGTFACCSCGAEAPSEAHHAGRRGVSQKAGDDTAVPLCFPCHRERFGITDNNTLPGRTRAETAALFAAEQERLQIEWEVRLGERAA